MASIKEIAQKTGFSLSTVSIVLNGKAEERKISDATRVAVLDAARELGYVPNIAARRLRSSVFNVMHIALYASMNFDTSVLIRFIHGLRTEIADRNDLEISMKLFSPGAISKILTPENTALLNAAIVFSATADDLAYLEKTDFNIPIILNNRTSEKYPSICLDSQAVDSLPIDVFHSHGKKTTQLLTYDFNYPNIENRKATFSRLAEKYGMEVYPPLTSRDSIKDGYKIGTELARSARLPECLCSFSQRVSYGLVRAFLDNGIRIPGDIEIISVGNGDDDAAAYMTPSLSVVAVSQDDVAKLCYKKLMQLLDGKEVEHTTVVPVSYIPRETCGPLIK